MKKLIIYLILIVSVSSFASCESWLDVEMKTKVKSDVLLQDEQGFRDALIGVYTGMTTEALYGRELTYGFFEVLVGGYDIDGSNTQYYDISQGALDNTSVRARTDRMWEGLYNTIANVNNILDNIDAKRAIFSGDMYSVIKGEALALRALLHFQVFKIFADASDLSKKAIPYVRTLGHNVVPSSSGAEVLGFIQADLKEAMTCLEKDPVYTVKKKVDDSDPFMNNRQMRMNYYASMALYAEAALWAGNTTEALDYAKRVIAVCDEVFPWVDPSTVTTSMDRNRDFTFSTEHLFCVNVFNLRSLYTTWISPSAYNMNYLCKGSYYFDTWYQSSGIGSMDYRYVYLKTTHNVNTWNYSSLKFSQPEGYRAEYATRIPIIRRSLMYYIAAECETDPARAKGYLDQVRAHRGINVLLSEYNETELRREYVKELWQEGHLFFFHKRKNITTNPSDRYLPFQLRDKYIIQKPEAEIEYGQ